MAAAWSVVQHRPGPAWTAGLGPREQPLWDEHAAFVDDLADRGILVLAGPYEDWSGALVLYRLAAAEARELVAGDPWVVHGVFAEPDVRPWLVWVDRIGLGGR